MTESAARHRVALRTSARSDAALPARTEEHAREVGLRAKLVVGAMIGTFIVLRIWLHAFPGADLFVLGYNVHHLFSGIALLTVSGLPLAVGTATRGGRRMATGAFGSGLGLVLDEVVYLIATDGTNASYTLPVSLWGAAAAIGVATLVALGWYRWVARHRSGAV